MRSIYFENGAGDAVVFEYRFADETTQTEYMTQSDTVETVRIGTNAAYFYPAGDTSETSNLIWLDADTKILFTLDSTLEKQDMLHIAESIILEIPTKS